METEDKYIKLGPSAPAVYFSISSQSTLEEGSLQFAKYLRTTRQSFQAKGRIMPIATGVPAFLCLCVNSSPREGFAAFGRGLVFSTPDMTRRFPTKIVLQENPLIEASFDNPTIIKFEMATFMQNYYAFDITDTGELVRRHFLTQMEIDALTASTHSQLEPLVDPHLQASYAQGHQEDSQVLFMKDLIETGTSPISEFFDKCEQLVLEKKEEIMKEKTFDNGDEDDGKTDQVTARTANTLHMSFSDLPSDISDYHRKLEGENEALKTENFVAIERMTFLEKQDQVKTEKILFLDNENQSLKKQVSSLQEQVDFLTTQLAELRTTCTELQMAKVVKRKKPKFNSGEYLESDQQTPASNKMSVESPSSELEEEKQDRDEEKNLGLDINHKNPILQNIGDIVNPQENFKNLTKPSQDKEGANPMVLSALESLADFETKGLSSGVIDLFINLHCAQELKKQSDVKIYDSTKWDAINTRDNLLTDYGYEDRRSVLYPLHLEHDNKQYWALLVLRNTKKTWDHKAEISAYYLSSLDLPPPKDLLHTVLLHIVDSVQKRLDKKEIKLAQKQFPYRNTLEPPS